MDFSSVNELSVLLRLCIAALFGGILGFERTRKMRGAGLRTYMLVCIGATMAMMTGQYIFEVIGGNDPSRIAAQVVSGIGFIGAGTIMVTGHHSIKGLTTAAGLWLCACLGLAIGSGFYVGATIMLVISLVSIILGEKLQTNYLSHSNRIHLYAIFDCANSIATFLIAMQETNIQLSDFEFLGMVGDSASARFMLKLPGKKHDHVAMLAQVEKMPGVVFVEEV